jgi:hypothetical protein
MSTPDITLTWPGGDAEGGRFEGWPAWAEHVRALLAVAAQHPADLLCLDHDFSHWPLGERGVVDSLGQWALASRHMQCTMVAMNWEHVAALHPRWVQWRTPWSHKVPCRTLDAPEQASLQMLRPMLILRGVLGLQLIDDNRGTAVWTRRPAELAQWWQTGDAILQRSVETLPVTTLGL